MKLSSPALIALFFFTAIAAGSATAQQATQDSLFEAHMRNAWQEIEKSESAQDLQRKYAAEFFQYYQEHPSTETGTKAGWQAFMMWGNTAAADEIEVAMSQIPYDSAIWGSIIQYIGNAYFRSEEREMEDYFSLLEKLKSQLSHPRSKSSLLLMLARHYHAQDRIEEAQNLYREIVNLDVSPFFVDQALGGLYEMESLEIGQTAPMFTAESLGGYTVSLADQRGRYVLLEFWATWCGPCLPEIPHLKSIWSRYKDDGLKLIGIAIDDDPAAVEAITKEWGMEWAQILESWDSEIARSYNVSGIPRAYLIGPDGTIVAKDMRGQALQETIDEAMKDADSRGKSP